jgi:hypothetical protein
MESNASPNGCVAAAKVLSTPSGGDSNYWAVAVSDIEISNLDTGRQKHRRGDEVGGQ